MKVFHAVALSFVLMASALAQDAEFYVVQDKTTKKCSVSDKKPTSDSEMIIVSDGIYRTRTEAEAGIEKIAACPKS
jgi:hypothetical protein